jgi:hypothetical protein
MHSGSNGKFFFFGSRSKWIPNSGVVVDTQELVVYWMESDIFSSSRERRERRGREREREREVLCPDFGTRYAHVIRWLGKMG